MKYFLDTEFNEEVDPVDLISIGVVADDGRELYAINHEYNIGSPKWETCHQWVRDHVKPVLILGGMPFEFGGKEMLRNRLRDFVGNDPYPEFWGYFADYDWYLVCRLFGTWEKMPKNWSNICYDLKQLQKQVGVNLPKKFDPEHNALIDARWTKHSFEYTKRARDNREDATNAAFGQPPGKSWP